MSEITQAPNQGMVIANILPSLRDLPNILEVHKSRVEGATLAGTRLIESVDPNAVTADQDEDLKKFIIRINDAETIMKQERMPYTQIIGEITKMFTGNEGKLVPLRDRMQQLRNARATQVANEEKRRREEAEQKARKNTEAANIIAFITRNIEQKLGGKLIDRKNQLNTSFAGITLENFDLKEAGLRALRNPFPVEKLDEILNYFIPGQQYHTANEVTAINADIRSKYDFQTFYTRYEKELDQHRQDLIDRLPSKKDELLEAKRITDEKEQLRLRQEQERLRQEELQRQQQKANADEKLRLQQEQERLRQQQEQTAREQREKQAEQDRLQREKDEREEKDRLQLALEQERSNTLANDSAETARATSVAGTLFDQTKESVVLEKGPETRMSFEIDIHSFAAFAELFQMWFLAEAAEEWKKGREKFEKISFWKLVAYAEKQALKGKKIESQFLTYKEVYTAVNRKDKPKEY